MRATFSDDDIDKPVRNANGDEVGVIAAVEGDIAHVRPDPSAVESIKSSLGWDGVAEQRITLDRASVREITADAVRLEGELPVHGAPDVERGAERDPETEPAGGMSGLDETEIDDEMEADRRDSADDLDAVEDRGRGAEVDPAELTDRDTGLSARPDEGAQRTDAAVEPTEDADRTDAAVDPDAVRESDAADRGPTTEDGARGVDDDPEEKRLADAGLEDETDDDATEDR
ncbi:hypothetical protein [Natrinema sp. 1APR25-10V2]|uniref:hypothetical protein n=1 Tax=Natrinema sp. 1APR25-10V2 TaxID=2951081 RepID=UPI0028762A75|nr:hypothetical protein [Natrinema sp. 1APR25-10V2]MDS0475807.1 hypothetical protein [Natrinema sp. 1APR25-10V2]